MKQVIWTAVFTIVVFFSGLQSTFAQVPFSEPREFVVEKPCKAYAAIKKKTQAKALEVCKTYTALGENKQQGPTHAFIQLGGKNKWVDLNCGHYTDTNAPNSKCNPKPDANCLPFFDNIDNPVKIKVGGTVDMTPPAPILEPFDQAINATCGAAGKVVSEEEFKTLLRNHPDVLQRIMAFTNRQVYANRPARESTENYLADLTEAWFSIKAFDHIMCGQPEAGKAIGGLHFHGRYQQLQQSGEACRLNNLNMNEAVSGVLYSMGATMKAVNGGSAKSPIKGYGLTLSAEDILKTATRAFVENPTQSSESTACLQSVSDDGKQFTMVFVRRASGIRTFYPDATPAASDPACKATIDLAN
jgi:hypothetical protein